MSEQAGEADSQTRETRCSALGQVPKVPRGYLGMSSPKESARYNTTIFRQGGGEHVPGKFAQGKREVWKHDVSKYSSR